MKKICLIVACDENHAIGRGGTMPWHLPADLAHFKQVTLGHPIIMGRKTFDSIGRPLPGRQNLVITRQQNWRSEGVDVATSLIEALALAEGERVFVIGGGEIYQDAMARADELFVTRIHGRVADADTWFPVIDPKTWKEVEATRREADERNAFDLTFLRFERRVATD